ncbi:MAG: hypothetical protein P1V97_09220 [Planctomycetota bacterium]|nr:hypothetical protein [Planctomycetota bacterium]
MNSNITISIAKKESDKERCGYCFDGLFNEETWVCDACETSLHKECHDELQSCTTMGCQNKTHSSDDLTSQPRRNRRPRRARRAGTQRTESGRYPLSTESRILNILGLIFLTLILIVLVPITITVLLFGLIMFAIAAFSGDFGVLVGIFIGFGLSSSILVYLSIVLLKIYGRIMKKLQRG